jgi:predicted dienelactone hydrolase
MRDAASVTNFALRCEDVRTALDQLEAWNRTEGHPLCGRLDLAHVGMSGHSFGAQATQAVSGQKFPLGKSFLDDRIDAAIAFSPGSPAVGSKSQAFGGVEIPWMLMTGTKDVAAIGGQSVRSRLEVFPNLPKSIDKFELVLNDAEHSAFTDRSLPGDKVVRNPNHHRAILALSTAFWDAYLKEDSAAKAWLGSDAVTKVLDVEDRWQKNFGR